MVVIHMAKKFTSVTDMTFFPLYLGNRQNPRGKTFFFGERLIFAENRCILARKPFLFEIAKIILGTFFLETTCALCPWPRAFLSLASRGSVLERSVLGLGIGFFLCPWHRSCVLDSTSVYTVFDLFLIMTTLLVLTSTF